MTYSEQLKSPMWQKKRLEIMQKYNFQCQMCFDKNMQQHVHHKYYLKNIKAWEYKDECYTLLCNKCHSATHKTIEQINANLSVCVGFDINKNLNHTDISFFLKQVQRILLNDSNSNLNECYKIILSQTIKENEI